MRYYLSPASNKWIAQVIDESEVDAYSNGCDSYHDLQFNGGAGVEDESDTICPIPGSMQKTKKLHLAGRGLGGGKKDAWYYTRECALSLFF